MKELTQIERTPQQKIAVCVFRADDVETDCFNCKRIRSSTIPVNRQAWQYVPKFSEGVCPAFVGVRS